MERPVLSTRRYTAWAVATSLVLAVSLAVQQHWFTPSATPYPEPPGTRGQVNEAIIHVAKPRAAAEALRNDLSSAGVTAHIYQQGQRYFVDFEIAGDFPPVIGRSYFPQGIPLTPGPNRLTLSVR
jgi:hypothetical protein